MARTENLPGVEERMADKELNRLAESYVEARDDRMKKLKSEVELKTLLIQKMKSLKLHNYYDDESGLTITLESKNTLKVKIASDDDDDED